MLFIAFIAFLAVEALVIYAVSQWIGGLYVLALLALGAFCGGALINRRSEKAKTLFFWRAAPDNVTFGGRQSALNSLFAFLAGLLLIFPGFVSDGIALLLLFPPLQAIVAAFLGQYLAKKASSRFQAFYFGGFGGPAAYDPDARGGARVYRDNVDEGGIIEGEFREIDPEEARRGEPESGMTLQDNPASGHAWEDSGSSGR